MQQYFQELGPDKKRLDQLYVRYRSFFLDMDVLFWTALVLLPLVGAHTPPEQLLFVGPVTRLIRRHGSWFIIDLLVTGMAIGFTGLVWRAFGPLDVGWPRAAAMGLGFALLFSVSGAVFGVNRVKWTKAADGDALDLLPGWVLATAAAYFINAFAGSFPGELVLAAAILALLSFIIVRYRSRLVTGIMNRFALYRTGVRSAAERVLIVGSGPVAQLAAWILAHPNNARNFRLVGFIDDDLLKQETRIYGAHVLGTCKELPRLVNQYDVGVVILADERILAGEGRSILESCRSASARMVVVPDVLANLGRALGVGPARGRSICNPTGDGFFCEHCLARLASTGD
jgi:FlaA1/EpsC-like NDP-sugar epimerase